MPDAKFVLTAVDETKGAFQSVRASLNGLDTDVTKLTAGLGGLAAALGAVAVGAIVADTVKAAAALADLSTVAGASVESLSKFSSVARLSGTDIDSVANAMNKLAKNMAGATEDGKGAAAALRAIGVDFTSFARLSPDEKMRSLAQALDEFQDGSDKSAVAMALLGKEGARLLPFLKGLAVAGDVQAKITSEQARQSKELEDNLKRLSASGDAWKKELAAGMTPALNVAAQAFTDVMNGTGGLREAVRQLSKDGTIADWTRGAITALTYLMDTVEVVVRVFKVSGRIIYEALSAPITLLSGSLRALARAASGDMSGAAAEMKAAFATVGEGLRDIGKAFEEATGTATFGSKVRERVEQLQNVGAAAEKAKKGLTFREAGDVEKQWDSILKGITERTAAYQQEINQQAKLSDAQKFAVGILTQLRDGTLKLSEEKAKLLGKLLEEMLLLEKRRDLDAAARKATEEAVKAHEDLIRELDTGTQKIREELEAQLEHNTAMLLGKEAAAELAAAKLEEKAASLEALAVRKYEKDLDYGVYELYLDQAKALRELAAAKRQGGSISDQIRDFKSVFDSIDRTAHDVWTNIFEGGSNAFKKLGQTLKSAVLDLLYQMTVRPFVINLVANLTGTSGGIAQAALGNALGGGSGGLGSLLGLGRMGMQYLGGSMSGANLAGTMYANATGTGLDGLLAATGAYGTAGLPVAAGSIASGFLGAGGAFGGGVGALTGAGGVASGVTFGVVDAGAVGAGVAAEAGGLGALGALGAIPGWGWALAGLAAIGSGLFGKSHGPKTESGFGPNVAHRGDPSGAQQIAQGIQAQYASIASALGIANANLADLSVFYAKDPNGTARTQLQIAGGSYSRAAMYGGQFENVGRSDAEFQQAVSLASAQLIVKNLQEAAGGKVGDFLKSIDIASASLDTLQNALQIAQDVGSFTRMLDAFGGAFSSLKGLSVQDSEALVKGLGGLQTASAQLQAFYNDFVPEAQKKDAILRSLVATFAQANVVLPTTRAAFVQAVQAAMAAGDTHALQTLLSAEQAFNQLYPAIESGVDGALAALKRAADAEKQAAQAARDAAQERVRDIGAVMDALKGGIDTLYGQVDATVQMRASQAQQFLAQALGTASSTGYLPDSGQLSDAIGAATAGIANTVFASVKDREFAQLALAGQLSQLRAVAGTQLTDAQLQLQAANAQIDRLDQIVSTAQQQVDALHGVDNSVKSVAAALGDFAAALAGDQSLAASFTQTTSPQAPASAPSTPAPAAASDPAQEVWSEIMPALRRALGGSLLGGIPAFAGGGWHEGGAAIVGDGGGPELAVMPPARIFNARDTQALLGGAGNQAVVNGLAALEAALLRIERASTAAVNALARVEGVSRDTRNILQGSAQGKPLLVEIAA